MFVGIATLGIVTASIASYFVGRDQESARAERAELADRLDRIEELLASMHARVVGSGPDDAELTGDRSAGD
jgi:membrane protein DedA with SNARE-associated domain